MREDNLEKLLQEISKELRGLSPQEIREKGYLYLRKGKRMMRKGKILHRLKERRENDKNR